MKLWLDDKRLPPDDSWTWVRSCAEARSYLLDDDIQVEEMSLDHDLGLGVDKDGRTLALWMAIHDIWPVHKPTCHSMNPPGRNYINGVIDRYFESCECPTPIGSYGRKCMACEQPIRRKTLTA